MTTQDHSAHQLENIDEKISIRNETVTDQSSIENLHSLCFGPGRFARTAFRLRENKSPDYSLSFIAQLDGEMLGAIRLTPISIGTKQARLLGPLCAVPKFKHQGIGRKLMKHAMDKCKDENIGAVLLVGDLAYYAPFGFENVPNGQVSMPGPVDPVRLLIAPLNKQLGEPLNHPLTHPLNEWSGKVS